MRVEQFYLDLKKVNKIKCVEERQQIHRYYQDMMHAATDGRDQIANSIMMTLIKAGYLIDCRDEKLDELLT
jgi:hypothetical protein